MRLFSYVEGKQIKGKYSSLLDRYGVLFLLGFLHFVYNCTWNW